MLGQLKLSTDGQLLDKVELAIQRLKAFEPPEGYYLAFSGGKDSQTVYHLAKKAGVKFDAHYAVTSVDPPELIRFIKQNYPDVKFERKHDKDGNPITMWSLIPAQRMPPTQIARYCCAKLKETDGKGRFVVTGVRASESPNRKANGGIIKVPFSDDELMETLEDMGINFTVNTKGGVILNYDNADNNRMVGNCIRTGKVLVNPIFDWEEEDVWEFLNMNGIEHCCLYDEGFTRLGCIGCPMGKANNQKKQFERWPKYRELYLKAFERMIKIRKERGLNIEGWETPEAVMQWWLDR